MSKLFRLLLVSLLILMMTMLVTALEEDIMPAPIVNDEGGPVVISGEVAYTGAFFTAGASEPLIILEDQSGFVNRDRNFLIAPESQVLGQITSNFYSSPFSYTISLPIEPQAQLNDVDNDSEADLGVMVFQVAYWNNAFGDAFLQDRDLFGGGWSSAYASAAVSAARATQGEYTGGNILIYAPVEGQAFPSGFGDDALLFTDDDPLVIVPQGYTVVNMDTETFTFDRSREVTIDLIEGEGAEADDFSEMGYLDAYEGMLEKFRNEYAFTELKNLDWDEIEATTRPLFEEADEADDIQLYARALMEFVWLIPDGHVSSNAINILGQDFLDETDGGLGIAIREVEDGRIIVNYLLEGSPADEAGIQLGTEIIAIDDVPIADAVADTFAWSEPFSVEHVLHLQQLRYVTRFPLETVVDVTFINADGEEETATMEVIAERDSFNFSSFNVDRSGIELPVEWEFVDDYLYVTISSFIDDDRLQILLWERMIRDAQASQVEGIIIDMRNNGGGSSWLAYQMGAYFYQESFEVGNTYSYDIETGEFILGDEFVEFILPSEDLRFNGEVVVIVGPNCGSACEHFAYGMTIDNRATILGHYPTMGLGGGVERFFMPDNVFVQITINRRVDSNSEIHIEGIGIVPDVVVPINEETLQLTDREFIMNDPLIDAAVAFLHGETAYTIVDAGIIGYDEEITGNIDTDGRVRYEFTILADQSVSIYLDGDLDTVLRLYDETGENLILENDDIVGLKSGIEDILLEEDATIIIEVATFNDDESGIYTLIVTTGENPLEE